MIACGKIGARSAGPIGCRVCGFKYGAGGAGMSGRMLYQRSGISLSLSRIFFNTASSLLPVALETNLPRVRPSKRSGRNLRPTSDVSMGSDAPGGANESKEVEAMRTRWRFLQLLLIGAALAGVFIIQAGSPSSGVLTHSDQHQ